MLVAPLISKFTGMKWNYPRGYDSEINMKMECETKFLSSCFFSPTCCWCWLFLKDKWTFASNAKVKDKATVNLSYLWSVEVLILALDVHPHTFWLDLINRNLPGPTPKTFSSSYLFCIQPLFSHWQDWVGIFIYLFTTIIWLIVFCGPHKNR